MEKQDGTLKLYIREIYFEVQNETFMTGKTHKAQTNANHEAAANMQASDDEEYAYKIQRSISNALNSVKSKLGEYVKEAKRMTNNLISSLIKDNGIYILALNLPSNYNYASFDLLSAAIHDYIVKQAIFEFFTITNTAEAATYKTLAADALALLFEALYKRSRPIHKAEYFDNSDDGDPTIKEPEEEEKPSEEDESPTEEEDGEGEEEQETEETQQS